MVVLSEISASCSSIYHYDVFLSFRGIDTRYGFTAHLHEALLDAAIKTFFDDDEIETGEVLKPELESAIKASRASIIVLSENYASSTWCLDELVLILEQHRTSKHIVIPIFYHVKPTDVRKQQSKFGEAMETHKQKILEAEPSEKKRSRWEQKMKQWEKALTNVADMKGLEPNNRRETILIESIVTEITSRLELHKRSKIPHLIGRQSSVPTITSFLKDESSQAIEILTISGMAGIGKTYLAKYVFKLHYLDFKRSSFLEDIERECKQPNGLLDLQKQLLTDIGYKTGMGIHDIDVGTSKIEELLLRKKTLLVLDGIDQYEQLDMLIGTKGLHPGSKVIVTTKEATLTEKYCRLFVTQVPPKHKTLFLESLNQEESLQLLSWHAFRGNYLEESYEIQAREVVKYCGGHPLALKVLGGSLLMEDEDAWEDTIELLQKQTNPTIQKVLQISFDSLPNETDKELFKHIACFFIGEDKELTEAVLVKCGMSPRNGFKNLIGKCLLTAGPTNKLIMHQLLQEMGRDLVRQESPDKPWKRSRLWHHKESYDLLKKEKGTKKIQGLVLDMRMSTPNSELEIRTNAFSKMDKLRLLQLHYVQLHGSYEHFPTDLRWLSMHGFPLNCVPSGLQMENMVALDMSYSNLQQLWKKPKMLRSLKFLILRCCQELVNVGHFDRFPLLERLILAGCMSLVEVCESIYQCGKLLLFDVSGCTKLKRLPRSIGELRNLRTLLINGCSNLDEFPMEMENMESLEVLEAANMALGNQVSSSIFIEAIPRRMISFAISLPRSLVSLSLQNNNLSNESFPLDFESLPMLEKLFLDGNPIESLPNCIRSLRRLELLSLRNCHMLKTVLCAPSTLTYLGPLHCRSLERITLHPGMSRLPFVNFLDSLQLTEVEGKFKMQAIVEIDEVILHSLGWIDTLQQVRNQRLPFVMRDKVPQLVLPVQMLYEPGILSTFFQGNSLPKWMAHISFSSRLCFTVPSSHKSSNVRGLNLCIVTKTSYSYPEIRLHNSTKSFMSKYRPRRYVLTKTKKECMIWLSHWMFENNEFEEGDRVDVEFIGARDTKMCGASVMYDDGNGKEDALVYYKSWDRIIKDQEVRLKGSVYGFLLPYL